MRYIALLSAFIVMAISPLEVPVPEEIVILALVNSELGSVPAGA